MQKRSSKIMVSLLLVAGVLINLHLCFRQETDWGMLMKENVEALTTPEDNPDYPCVKAHGFCIINGIEKVGIAFIHNK